MADAGEVSALWEVFVAEQYADFLPDDAKLVVDGGANVGTATAWFRGRYPSARVIAVEPDPFAIERLRRNVGDDPQVKIVHAALSSEDGVARFLPGDLTMRGRLVEDERAHSSDTLSDSSNGLIDVESLTLGTLLQRVGDGSRVDVLKLDVEGSEWHILGGPLGAIDVVTVEIHSPTPEGVSPETILSGVASREGFTLRRSRWPSIRWLVR